MEMAAVDHGVPEMSDPRATLGSGGGYVPEEFATRTPWAEALDTGERECLLTLLRKMISAADSADAHQGEDWHVSADEPAETGGDPATN